jgi:hypothetical protein
MANWCECELEITSEVQSSPNEIRQLLSIAKDSKNQNDFSLENLLPPPKNCTNIDDWCMENWGTRWNIKAYIDHEDIANENEVGIGFTHSVSIKFESAWSPPLEAFEKISRLYPSLYFELNYAEEAMDFFGITKYKNGVQQEIKGSYVDRFEFNMEIDESSARIQNDNIHVLINLSYFDDPYDINGQLVENESLLTFPMNLQENDISNSFSDEIVEFYPQVMDNIKYEKEYDIIEFIRENLELMKTMASHNDLNTNLPINQDTQSKKRKI